MPSQLAWLLPSFRSITPSSAPFTPTRLASLMAPVTDPVDLIEQMESFLAHPVRSFVLFLLRPSSPPYVSGFVVPVTVRPTVQRMPWTGAESDFCQKCSEICEPLVADLDSQCSVVFKIRSPRIQASPFHISPRFILRAFGISVTVFLIPAHFVSLRRSQEPERATLI